MTITVPSEAALAELCRVHAYARQQAAQGADKAMAQAHVAKWCAIAAWFGTVLPDDLAMHDSIAGTGQPAPLWTDYAPPGTPVDAWRQTIALELRSYTQRAVARAEQGQDPKALNRAIDLLTLARHLSQAAGLPAPHPEERKAA